jgi:hypothetical protein
MKFERFAETTAFRQVVSTITALSTQDERIAEEFRAIERGRKSSGTIVEIEGDVPVGMKIRLGDFAEAISTRLWQGVGRANWRKFEDARADVRRLGLKSNEEWRDYCTSGTKPADIPTNPDGVYAQTGWISWGDWFGTGVVASYLRPYRSFRKAREFARSLGLKSQGEWFDYCKSDKKKPDDIPTAASRVYAKKGWSGWDDWLGNEKPAPLPFKQARAFVRRLGLKSPMQWTEYCKSGKKPAKIPATPIQLYAKDGWAGMCDWLGYSRYPQYRPFKKARSFVRRLGLKSNAEWKAYCKSGKKPADIPARPFDPDWRPFKKARVFVRRLGLKSQKEWFDYCKSDKKPNDIPTAASSIYAKDGWSSWGDWLGNVRFLGPGRPFKRARTFVRRLGLKSYMEWRDYCKSGKKPSDIPASPAKVYAENGWSGWGDWLGTGRYRVKGWRPFKEARAFACRLGLKDGKDWFVYCKSGKKPSDIPTNPNTVYAETGWGGWGDWVGNGKLPRGQHRSFKKARSFVRRLGLKSYAEWLDYCKSGKKPNDIPSNPNTVYAEAGWVGLGDWLGNGAVATRLRKYRLFKKARAFVRRLHLKSGSEWRDYCKSNKKPYDIPSHANEVYAKTGWAGMHDWLGDRQDSRETR